MKNLFLASLLLMSSNVFASKLVTIKSLTNPTLNSAANELNKMEFLSHNGMKKVVELSGKGKTAQEIRQNTVAQVLHTVCPFFDDGVSIGVNSKDEKGTLSAVADLIDSSSVSKGDAEYNQLVKNVSAVNTQANVELYSGSASGNNTMGTVLGFYDLKNNEIAVFSNTNCGSDD